MQKNNKSPSIRETAFECPHCGSFTSQSWYTLHADPITGKRRFPLIPTNQEITEVTENTDISEDIKKVTLHYFKMIQLGLVSLQAAESSYQQIDVYNLHLSECFNCKKIAVWVHDRLIFPAYDLTIQPNADLPEEIIRDFKEANGITGISPRGAAALLRLCIQKLCVHLGEEGKDLNRDIASLVKKGLNPLVQKSLDIVRVIGNEAVHPGTLDIKDDPDTANRLFSLINTIGDQMISHPKNVEELYAKLPESKRKAIELRDQKKSVPHLP